MAALAPVVDAIDQVPEKAREFYVQKDGKFVLDLSGTPAGYVAAAELAAANGKVVEFRDNNVALLKEVETLRPLKTQFEGITAEEARAAIAAQKGLKDKGVNAPDDLQKVIDAAQRPLLEKLTAMEAAVKTEAERADEATFRTAVSDVFSKAKGETGALDFIVGEAKKVFQVKDRSVTAQPNIFSTDKPGELLGLEEWMTQQVKKHSFAFGKSAGGGATPPKGTQTMAGVVVIKNPTPAQLGDAKNIAELRAGRLRFEYGNE